MILTRWAFLLIGLPITFARPGVFEGVISSPNGSCGGSSGYTCFGSFFGNCCGADGVCGSDPEKCGAGCQSDFGFCQDEISSADVDTEEDVTVVERSADLIGSSALDSAVLSLSGPDDVGAGVFLREELKKRAIVNCPSDNGKTFKTSAGDRILIECGLDYPGGDLPNTGSLTATFDLCLQSCVLNSNCVAVSWVSRTVGGDCWLKKSLGKGQASSKIHSGHYIKGGSAASSQGSATTSKPASASKMSSPTLSTIRGSPSTCKSVSAPTGTVLPGCTRCAGQPGNGRFCGFDINTNWYKSTPKTCKVVHYEFDITETTISPDGMPRLAMVVNGQMPGPTIHASWGDTVVVKVNNRLRVNGSSIHFHGMRQLNNNMYDGVTSLTQCPIAPGSSMTYTWVAENYGTSWWHSHFGLQTWEGVFGPMIIDGPFAQEFDEDLGVLTLQDWTHVTIHSMYDRAQNATLIPGRTDGATYGGPQTMDTGLINGMNVWGDDNTKTQRGDRYELEFEKGNTYLIRIVNTAIQSTYKFSIDGHSLTVIANDFVPIKPYRTNVVSLSIGQRYDILVKADQKVANYWLRNDNQESCAHTTQNRNIKAIIRYSGADRKALPTSKSHAYTDSCVDEPSASLVPIVPMNVGPPDITEGTLDVIVRGNDDHVYKWYTSGTTFFSQYDDPPLFDIANNQALSDYPGILQVSLPQAGKWVYAIIETPIPLPHPLHLHGHDFFLLAAGAGTYNNSVVLRTKNPPRRDTVLMPGAGYVVIAFVTDNPGAWLFHCHIGWHVAMGLAMSFIEMQDKIVSSGAVGNSCGLNSNCQTWKHYADARDIAVNDSGV